MTTRRVDGSYAPVSVRRVYGRTSRVARRQTISNPPGRQIAEVSARMRETSEAVMPGPEKTLMTIGGSMTDVESPRVSTGSGANEAAAISAAARPVAISIMPAIDGIDRQKFDVRIRDERTVLNVEIDRYDVLAEADAELRDRHVALVLLVGVER